MLPVSIDCPILVAPLIFSYVYIQIQIIMNTITIANSNVQVTEASYFLTTYTIIFSMRFLDAKWHISFDFKE